MTTLATTSDFVRGEPIEQDLADRDLLPGSHLVDSGYVVAELLVTGPGKHQIDVVGPPLGSSSRQHRENVGYDLHAFVIDWEAQQAICPQGHRSVKWTPGPSPSGLSRDSHPVQQSDLFSLSNAFGVHLVEGSCASNTSSLDHPHKAGHAAVDRVL